MRAWRDLPTPLLPLALVVTSAQEPISAYDWFVGAVIVGVAVFLWLTLRN